MKTVLISAQEFLSLLNEALLSNIKLSTNSILDIHRMHTF